MPTWFLWSLAALAVAVTAWLARRPSELSLGRTASALVLLATGVGFLLPAASGLLARAGFLSRSLEAGDGGGAVGAVLCGGAWLGLGVWAVLGPPRRLDDRRFLWIFGAVLLLARIGFVTTVEMKPMDDFAKMWATAGELAQDFEVPPAPRSPDDHARALRRAYFERSLPVLLPLRLVFGGGPVAYRLTNVALLVGSSLLLFFLARGWFGSRAARVAFVASQLAPETWVAQLLPTHDVPGAFLTLVCVVLAVRLWVRSGEPVLDRPKTVGLVVALIAALEVLDLQRTNAAPLVLAWVATSAGAAIFGDRRRNLGRLSRRLALCLLPVVGFVAVEVALAGAGVLRDPGVQKERKLKKVAAYTDSWGDGSSNHWKAEWVGRPLEDGDWGHFVRRKYLTDTVLHPGDRIAHAVRKANLLYDLGSQTHFYLRGAVVPSFGPLDRTDERRYRQFNAVFVAGFLALVLAGSLSCWHRSGAIRIELFPMVYLAVLSGFLIYAFETQPRYLFQVWTLGALYAGVLLPRPASPSPEEPADA